MRKFLFVVLLVCACICANAQKAKGDFSFLTGQKQLNVVFVYDGVTYNGDSEAEFFKATATVMILRNGKPIGHRVSAMICGKLYFWRN